MPDYVPLVQKLLDKTAKRKIDWKGTYDSGTFIAVVEGDYSFELSFSPSNRVADRRSLVMKDHDGAPVLELQASQPTQDSSQSNDDKWTLLEELWEEARATALNIDEKISQVSNILDTL
jgi:hypothetical protein